MKHRTCCFTGHRALPASKMQAILANLHREIDALIEGGVRDFLSGGALGFDQIAASIILDKRQMCRDVRLILTLPCKDQDARWNEGQRVAYRALLRRADEVIYVSEAYDEGCMKRRNAYMVARSDFCLCALLRERSCAGQTVRLARQSGLKVIDVIART